MKNNYKPWTGDEDDFLIAMWEEGVTHAEIAKTLGRTTHAVNMHLTRLNEGYVVRRVRIKKDV